MVKETILIFTAIFITAGCTLNNSNNNNKNLALRIPPNASNAVQSITTLKVGLFSETASSSDETIEQCQEFKLTEEQVKNFFSTAITVIRDDYVHSYLPSRCYVEGTLQSMSNENGRWYIDRARRGQIMYDSQESTYFFCNDCEEEIFYEACDLDCALDVPQ